MKTVCEMLAEEVNGAEGVQYVSDVATPGHLHFQSILPSSKTEMFIKEQKSKLTSSYYTKFFINLKMLCVNWSKIFINLWNILIHFTPTSRTFPLLWILPISKPSHLTVVYSVVKDPGIHFWTRKRCHIWRQCTNLGKNYNNFRRFD